MSDKQTDRNVYILGAGFSADANAPLLYNFLDKSRQLLDDPGSGLDGEEREEFRTVFEFRRKMAQAREKVKMDLDNIEQLFGLVEMQQRLGLGDSKARTATVYVIAKTLELMIEKAGARQGLPFMANAAVPTSHDLLRSYGLNPQAGHAPERYILDLYDFFAMLIGGLFDAPEKRAHRKDVVITFNYDLVLDQALMRAGIPISYHLPDHQALIGTGSPISNLSPRKIDPFSLLKLHGSTNWGICSNCKQDISVSFHKMTSAAGTLRSMQCRKCQQRAIQPMLVPPSWDKTEYQNLMQPIWNQAVTQLKNATRICIIGYSLPESDAYFKYLLTLGLAENHGLYKFIVVDLAQRSFNLLDAEDERKGKPKTLRERYGELLEDLFQERRFAFHQEGLWQWMQNGSVLRDLGRGEAIVRD